jgi:hypothetical protein
MEQRKHPAQFQNEQEWQEALKGRFEGLHGKIAELIGEKNSLQAKCERYETALKEIRYVHKSSGSSAAWHLSQAQNIAIQALSAGEGEKENNNG